LIASLKELSFSIYFKYYLYNIYYALSESKYNLHNINLFLAENYFGSSPFSMDKIIFNSRPPWFL